MILVVGIKDNTRVALEGVSDGSPESAKCGRVGNDILIISTKVVRLDNCVCTSAGNVIDSLSR